MLILFGSRARKTHRGNSDFDIAAIGKIDSQKWIQLKVLLSDDSPSLYSVDLVLYESLGDDYKKNIAHEGKLIYG